MTTTTVKYDEFDGCFIAAITIGWLNETKATAFIRPSEGLFHYHVHSHQGGKVRESVMNLKPVSLKAAKQRCSRLLVLLANGQPPGRTKNEC